MAAQGPWTLEALPGNARTQRWALRRGSAPLSLAAWWSALADEAEARAALTEGLRASPLGAFFWETPPLPADGDGPPAEFVLVETAALALTPADGSAFAAAFAAARGPVATFTNLGGDAQLVAPLPAHAPGSAHLAAFVRHAPAAVIDTLWTAVAAAVATWRAQRRGPLWVSTSGLAVPWLHVRLDGAPKYYAHRPYAQPPLSR
jgi:hypothetical protein